MVQKLAWKLQDLGETSIAWEGVPAVNMHALIVAMIVAVLSFEYLTANGWLPNILKFTPEILALIATVLVVVSGVQNGFRYVRPVYWFAFGGLAIVAACGVLVNMLEPGPLFAALRTYLRALPLFFLPAVMALEDRRLRAQLLLLLAFCFLQVPLALQQRAATTAMGWATGDLTFGTLMNAAWLTLFLISGACVLTGFYVKKKLRAKWFFPLLLIVLLPTTLNESKGALLILPVALLTVLIVGAQPRQRLKNAVIGIGILSCFAAIFIPVYDYYMKPRWGYGIVEFFTMEGRLDGYLDRGTEVGEYDRGAGKIGGPLAALRVLSEDPPQLAFGLGVGNVSDSALGEQFTGQYARVYMPLVENSLSLILFELGLAGLALVLLLYWLIFRDSIYVARTEEGFFGALAAGWSGVAAVMGMGLVYHAIIDTMALSALFWYFSGVVAAHRMRMAFGVRSAAPAAMPVFDATAGRASGATA